MTTTVTHCASLRRVRSAGEHVWVHLRTRRLLLRPFRVEDVASFERFAHAEDYRRFLGDHPWPAEFVANNLDLDGAWVIEFESRVVGSIFLGDELACLLDPDVHGLGIATEAARSVIDDGFERRGYEEIVAHADPANAASVHAMVRLGFVVVGDGSYRLRRAAWTSRDD
jgi:RimJ/RimL family protein N-acetyltransferase